MPSAAPSGEVPPQESESPPPPAVLSEHAEPLPTDGEESIAASVTPAQAPDEPPTRPVSGLLGRIPFLSSLLPPPRRRKGEEGGLPEWAVIAVILLLLSGERDEDDVLPFLLLLLLWN